jgi:hypothetical protein
MQGGDKKKKKKEEKAKIKKEVKLFYPNWSRKELRSLICKEVALESVVMT